MAGSDSDVEAPARRRQYTALHATNRFRFASHAVAFPLAAISFIIFFSYTVIPAGHVGVVDFFGIVNSKPLAAGFNLRKPFSYVAVIPLQTRLLEFHEEVPSNEGLMVGLDISVLYHVTADKVVELYINVGTQYQRVLVEPEVRSAIRDLTGKTSAKSLYSEGREGISKAVFKELNTQLNGRGIQIERVMLRGVKLPVQLQNAIEAKLQSEQESQRMEFVLLKEKQEAERKEIEAKGIAAFQDIVSQGISTPLLEWKGLEATAALAKSHNAKVVFFGNPQNGLPAIMAGLTAAKEEVLTATPSKSRKENAGDADADSI